MLNPPMGGDSHITRSDVLRTAYSSGATETTGPPRQRDKWILQTVPKDCFGGDEPHFRRWRDNLLAWKNQYSVGDEWATNWLIATGITRPVRTLLGAYLRTLKSEQCTWDVIMKYLSNWYGPSDNYEHRRELVLGLVQRDDEDPRQYLRRLNGYISAMTAEREYATDRGVTEDKLRLPTPAELGDQVIKNLRPQYRDAVLRTTARTHQQVAAELLIIQSNYVDRGYLKPTRVTRTRRQPKNARGKNPANNNSQPRQRDRRKQGRKWNRGKGNSFTRNGSQQLNKQGFRRDSARRTTQPHWRSTANQGLANHTGSPAQQGSSQNSSQNPGAIKQIALLRSRNRIRFPRRYRRQRRPRRGRGGYQRRMAAMRVTRAQPRTNPSAQWKLHRMALLKLCPLDGLDSINQGPTGPTLRMEGRMHGLDIKFEAIADTGAQCSAVDRRTAIQWKNLWRKSTVVMTAQGVGSKIELRHYLPLKINISGKSPSTEVRFWIVDGVPVSWLLGYKALHRLGVGIRPQCECGEKDSRKRCKCDLFTHTPNIESSGIHETPHLENLIDYFAPLRFDDYVSAVESAGPESDEIKSPSYWYVPSVTLLPMVMDKDPPQGVEVVLG